jgi:RsiW-degrading membrane proteinase PrsW (M82 family)
MGGVISGAGFALIESLLGTAQLLNESWIIVSSMRFGTTLIHMLASGLVGWGLASAWSQRKYTRLAGAYMAAVLLHGVWNGFAILFAVSQISPGHTPEFLSMAGKVAMWGLGVWTVIGLVALLLMNSRLRTSSTASPEI